MTLLGIWQDLGMLCVWLGSLLMGVPHPMHSYVLSSLRDTPTLVNIAKVTPGIVSIRRFTYRFEGTASSKSILHPNARLLVRLSSPHGITEKISTTDAEGRYSVELAIDAARHEPVDWSMQTDTEDGLDVKTAGRRIVMEDDHFIVVHDGRDSAPGTTHKPSIRYVPSTAYQEAAVG